VQSVFDIDDEGPAHTLDNNLSALRSNLWAKYNGTHKIIKP